MTGRAKRKTSPSKGFNDGLRILFWNAGGLNTSKFCEFKTQVLTFDADVFILVEAGASTDSSDCFNVTNYTNYVLLRARQVASGIIVGVKSTMACEFAVLHTMTQTDKHEAVNIKVWNNGHLFKITGIYNRCV